MQFTRFDIDKRFLDVLQRMDILDPTDIQRETIPAVLTGRDVIALAQTGTGKTLAYLLPALTRLVRDETRRSLLVLTPTRELAEQVNEVAAQLVVPVKLRSAAVYGGTGMERQTRALRRGCDVIAATPGRLLDHMGRGHVQFDNLSMLVMDEADRMLDMGFLPDIRRILARLPRKRQTIFCSATFPKEIAWLAREILHDPLRVEVGALAKPVDKVRQRVYAVMPEDKSMLLRRILDRETVQSALVFTGTKIRADRVHLELTRAGHHAAAIHGDHRQKDRQRALDGFRSGEFPVLVATDVAARGIDVDGLSHVINYDIPPTVEDYIHRIGRTARADAEGDAITFVCPTEYLMLGAIERSLGRGLPRVSWERSAPLLMTTPPPGMSRLAVGGRRLMRRR